MSVSTLSFSTSLLSASLAGAMVAILPQQLTSFPQWTVTLIVLLAIPIISYGISLSGSSLYQYGKCKKVNIKSISITNLIILATSFLVSGWLFLENLPLLKYIFGPYSPINPLTGEPYEAGSPEYESERHYKLQPLSSIVKAIFPVYWAENIKDGLTYVYWIFWAVMLPSFFLFTIQGTSC